MRTALLVALATAGCHGVAYIDVPVTWTLLGPDEVSPVSCDQVGNPTIEWTFVHATEDALYITLDCDQSGSVVGIPQGQYLIIEASASNSRAIPCDPMFDAPLTHLDVCALRFLTLP